MPPSPSACEGCGKPNPTLQCPTCKKLEIPPSLFCGQDCFKAAWTAHKAKHTADQVEAYRNTCSIKTAPDIALSGYRFAGPLRPGLMTPRRAVPDTIRRPDYTSRPDGLSKNEELSYHANRIPHNPPDRITAIKAACRVARAALDAGVAAAIAGATTDAVDSAVHKTYIANNCYPSTLGYMQFPKSCCTSLNEVICHGIPDSTVLQEGDILNIDVTCYSADGVHADMNETIFIGRPHNDDDIRLVHTAYESMLRAINTCVRPEALYKHIGDCIDPFCEAQGCSVVRDICGHGIGELFHCAPNVPHYKNNKTPGKMAGSHVFTIEPMVNAGSWETTMWPDDWTITTTDGKRSAQFEHQILVTKGEASDGSKGAGGGRAEILTLPDGPDSRPHYQRQLEALGVPLPELKEPSS